MTQQEATQAMIGDLKSPKRFAGAGQVTGSIYAIKALNGDATFSELTFRTGDGLVSGDRISEGDSITAPIKSFTLSGGVVLAYGDKLVQA